MYAIACRYKHPKQLWQLHAGQGKSRIIAAAALYALNETEIQNVHVVFPTTHLMERDKQAFEKYFYFAGKEDAVHYNDDLKFESVKGDLVIIDEVDHSIYNIPEEFFKFQQTKYIIGFTATASLKETSGLERSVFVGMNFHEATYWPSSEKTPFIDYQLRAIEWNDFLDVCKWVKGELIRAPVLLFCEEE